MPLGNTISKKMHPKPKLSKGTKKKQSEKRRRKLTAYRKEQMQLAYERDEGGCRICEAARADDCHHILGRGREAGDIREHYTNLIFVCRACHPAPIKFMPPPKDMEWIIELRDKINAV